MRSDRNPVDGHEAAQTPRGRLPRLLSVAETWAFGASGLLLWLFTVADMDSALGAGALAVWIPVTAVGIVINFQVKHLGSFWPEMAGGTPNYTTRLLRDQPRLARYSAFAYFQGWASVAALSAMLLADLMMVHLRSLEIPVHAVSIYIVCTSLSFAVALAGSRALGLLQVFFVVPAMGVLLGFVLHGLGWVALDVTGGAPATARSLELAPWAKWYFLAAYAAYSCETASSFVGDSKDPRRTLTCLRVIAALMPIVLVGGSWVFLHTAGSGTAELSVQRLVAAATPFWGRFAPLAITFLVGSGCLLGCATAAGNAPRILYQMALDGHAAPVFGVSSARGVLGPAVLMTAVTALLFLVWPDFSFVYTVTATGWLFSFLALHYALWRNRHRPESRWPRLSLALLLAESMIFVVGGIAWGAPAFIAGLMLPLFLMGADHVVRRAGTGPFGPEWWLRQYRQLSRREDHASSVVLEITVLLVVTCSVAALGWTLGGAAGGFQLAAGRALFGLFMLLAGFAAVAVAGWTVFPRTAAMAGAIELLNAEVDLRDRAETDLRQLMESLETQVAERTEAVRSTEQSFRSFVETTKEFIWKTDVQGTITYANPAVADILGHPPDVLIGRPLFEHVNDADRAQLTRVWLETVAAKGEWRNWRIRYQHRDGSDRYHESSAVAILDARGDVIGFQGTNRDVTERKLAEQAKSDFVSFVSHQLRTPLSGVKWMLELASAEDLPEQARAAIQDAEESTERLVDLINTLLDIGRLESGRLSEASEPVQLDEITRSIVDEIQTLIDHKRQRLTVSTDAPLPPVVLDPQLIRQALMNLVSNAIKYTPQDGTIEVSIRHREGEFEWAIRDSGIGIPRAAQDRLFEKFFRAENAVGIDSEGTGLGLHLVRLIVEHFGGRVWCESEEGSGTTFRIVFPGERSPATDRARGGDASHPSMP